MPTIITHAAVPICLGLGLGLKVIPPRLLFAGIALAMLPDADVLSFKLADLPIRCCLHWRFRCSACGWGDDGLKPG